MRLLRMILVLLLFIATIAVGSASALCSNATVTGVWGFQVGTAIGQFKADGNGHLSDGSLVVNSGVVHSETFTGTYSVASACTGKLTFNVTGGGTATANVVLDDANKGAQIIDTTPGAVADGFGVSEGSVTCGLTGTKTRFAALLLGKVSAGHIAYVAQVILDGKGNITGTGTFGVAGALLATSITGTYTENANCTGTIHITPKGSSTLNFAFVVVNAGKELLLLETDSNTSVAGNMQQ